MKKLLLLFGLLPAFTGVAQSIAVYDFTDAPGNQVSQPVTTADANVTASDITRGPGITASAATGSLSSYGWTGTSLDANDYYEFTVTPAAGYDLVPSGVTFTILRSGAGPANYDVTYQIGSDAKTSALASPGTLTTAPTTVTAPLTFTTSEPVRFRIYAWGAPLAVGTFRLTAMSVQGQAPMPVKLVAFDGKFNENAADQSVALRWSTAWEEQNAGFDLQKGINPHDLQKIAFVPGNMTWEGRSDYRFADADIQPGTTYYYRLKQNDTDGNYSFSRIIAVATGPEARDELTLVYPNPTHGQFSVKIDDREDYQATLYNAGGIEIPITVMKAGADALSVSTRAGLPTGLYHLLLWSENTRRVLKVVVQ